MSWWGVLHAPMIFKAIPEVSKMPDRLGVEGQTKSGSYSRGHSGRDRRRKSVERLRGWWGRRRQNRRQAKSMRASNSAAVTLALQPEVVDAGVTYAGILTKEQEAIDLQGLGIAGLRCRATRTCARILEVSGTTGGPKADALAEKLMEAPKDEALTVSRPQKSVVLQEYELDDSVTAEKVAAAVTRTGDYPPELVKAGKIVIARGLIGAALVRCPVVAAKRVMCAEKLWLPLFKDPIERELVGFNRTMIMGRRDEMEWHFQEQTI
ncbi:unnamed protein product [Danaus chrysippus]|uniref:(African queen) hypothetical protein n=1 Tax=Danaus chrysippus TaxID=151541 RepID=A0A8J2VYG3_9NEOP|nr:unnamed protein product [Danaus chrysippus]